MIEYAEHVFRLDRPASDGATEGDHIESARRQLAALGKRAKAEAIAPAGPPLPDLLDYLWDWFNEISWGVASSGMGPPVVTWAAVAHWSELTGNIVEPWEARTLVTLGMLRASIIAEKSNKP